MGTTADKLNGILNSKNAIKSAIQNKGINVGDATFAQYANKINNIETPVNGFIGDNQTLSQSSHIICNPMNNTKDTTNFSGLFYNHKLKDISWFDTSKGTDLSWLFNECQLLISIPQLDTSLCTNFQGTFYHCNSLKFVPLLDTSKATSFDNMFCQCTNLLEIPLFDTSSVTNFYCAFQGCMALKTIPLIDTSNATNLSMMFYFCQGLETIAAIDTSNATDFSFMFGSCINLTTLPELDVSSANSENSFNMMFDNCPALTNVGGFTGLKYSLDLSICSNLTHDSLMNIINKLQDVTSNPQTLRLWDNLNKLTSDQKAIATNKGWTLN